MCKARTILGMVLCSLPRFANVTRRQGLENFRFIDERYLLQARPIVFGACCGVGLARHSLWVLLGRTALQVSIARNQCTVAPIAAKSCCIVLLRMAFTARTLYPSMPPLRLGADEQRLESNCMAKHALEDMFREVVSDQRKSCYTGGRYQRFQQCVDATAKNKDTLGVNLVALEDTMGCSGAPKLIAFAE